MGAAPQQMMPQLGPINAPPVKTFTNPNPALGGTRWSDPGFAPMLAFFEGIRTTPDHEQGRFIIPWDHKNYDYVYPTCPRRVFKGRTTLVNLKAVGF